MDAQARARRVRLMVMDVDGVLTDGRLYIGAQGEVMKAFDVRDGHGIKLLRDAGIEVALLTARRSEIVLARARELGLTRVLQGQSNKLTGFMQLLADTGLELLATHTLDETVSHGVGSATRTYVCRKKAT